MKSLESNRYIKDLYEGQAKVFNFLRNSSMTPDPADL